MATMTERLALLISADVKGAVAGLNEVGKASKKHLGDTETKVDRLGRTFSKVGTGMLALGGAAAVGLYKTVDAASDLEQAVGGTEAVFKDASSTIDKYAKDAADNAGLSERAFREATTLIGGNLKRMGFSIEEAAEQSANLTQVGADLAATYGGTTAEAVDALTAAFRGEADPAERFNLNLKASVVAAKAVELGLADTTAAVSEQARAQALLALIAEQAADAQGQFAREAGSAAGSAQIASAKFEEARAALGESLAPVMAEAAGFAADLFGSFTSLNESTDGLASKLALGATGFSLIGGAALTAVGKVIELNRTLRDADGNLTTAGRRAATFSKILGGLAIAGLAYETAQWASTLGDVNFEIDKVMGLQGAAQAEEFKQKIREITRETGLFEISARAAGRWWQTTLGQGTEAEQSAKEAKAYFDDLIDQSVATAQAFRDVAAADTEFQDTLDDVGLTQEYLNKKLKEGVDAQINSAAAAEKSTDIVDEAAGATRSYASATEETIDPLQEMEAAIKAANDAVRGQLDPLFAAQDAMLDNAEAQREVAAAGVDVEHAQKELNRRVKEFGKDSPEAYEAWMALLEAEREFEDANRTAVRSALDVTTATTELAAKMRDGVVDIDAAKQQLNAWVDQGLITAEQARNVAHDLGIVGYQAALLDGQQARVYLTLVAEQFWRELARARFELAMTQLQAQEGGARTAGLQLNAGGIYDGERANGGPVNAYGTYLVGERGPEVLQMGALSGRVFSNAQSRAMATGNVYNIEQHLHYPKQETPSESTVRSLRRLQVALG